MCLSAQSTQRSHRFLLRFAYLGTRYSGVQRQVRERRVDEPSTIQGALETALNSCFRLNPPAVLTVSSRTDAGVHATQNTAHVDLVKQSYELQEDVILDRVNTFFVKYQQDVILREVRRVPFWFHSRYCAHNRTYIYRIAIPKCPNSEFRYNVPLEERNHCCVIPSTVDIELMQKVCKMFEGFHDFRSFQNVSKDPKPTEKCINEFSLIPEHMNGRQFMEPGLADQFSWWRFTITGRSFLYRQVRRMIGAAITVATGIIPIEEITTMLLAADKTAWNSRIKLAPAQGLHLVNVEYEPRMLDLNAPPPSWRPSLPFKGTTPISPRYVEQPITTSPMNDEIQLLNGIKMMN